MSKAKLYGQQAKYIPNAKADMGKRKNVYQRGREKNRPGQIQPNREIRREEAL